MKTRRHPRKTKARSWLERFDWAKAMRNADWVTLLRLRAEAHAQLARIEAEFARRAEEGDKWFVDPVNGSDTNTGTRMVTTRGLARS